MHYTFHRPSTAKCHHHHHLFLTPMCRIFIIIYLKQAMFLGQASVVLQLFVVTVYGTVMLFLTMNVLCIYISTPQSMHAVPGMVVFCRSLILCFTSILLRCCLNDSEMVPVAPIIGITYFYILHATCTVYDYYHHHYQYYHLYCHYHHY